MLFKRKNRNLKLDAPSILDAAEKAVVEGITPRKKTKKAKSGKKPLSTSSDHSASVPYDDNMPSVALDIDVVGFDVDYELHSRMHRVSIEIAVVNRNNFPLALSLPGTDGVGHRDVRILQRGESVSMHTERHITSEYVDRRNAGGQPIRHT